MLLRNYIFIFIYLCLTHVRAGSENVTRRLCFNKLQFGVATAAYQIEGAWNEDGKGPSIWDTFTHERPGAIADGSNADVAADSYHKLREDVQLLVDLNIQHYRFSISWPRILPNGITNEINEDGARYYNELLDLLLENNIKPLVTIYHWDLPQTLQDLGGWTNPLISEYFVDYARVLFKLFGRKVQTWITFNEPWQFCFFAYGGAGAPGISFPGYDDYRCGHNVLRSHAMVYRMYEREFKYWQNGRVGITIAYSWYEPFNSSRENQVAAETARQFNFGWFAHPIFSASGDYPPIMREKIDFNSKLQNFPRSRLPYFTPQEVAIIKGSADFLGINHYTTSLVSKSDKQISLIPSFDDDAGVEETQSDDWPKSDAVWLRVVPWGLRKCLNWIKDSYNNPPVIITENGLALEPGLRDVERVEYIRGYLTSLHQAIHVDRCDVRGYTYWSFVDDFEWASGYTNRFGLHEVDFTSPNRTRSKRMSAKYYAEIAKSRCIPDTLDLTRYENCSE